MKICLAYTFISHLPMFAADHNRFICSYLANPPGEKHSTVVICNGGSPDTYQCAQFSRFPDCSFFVRGNDGWDIGGYIELAKHSDADMLVCLGASAYITKHGWLSRIAKSFQDSGTGLYGVCASYQVRPHLNTGVFACSPELLARYPCAVVDKLGRYRFEHGPSCLWMLVAREKLPVKLVLWSGDYDWREWRKPSNIYWRGDQSNCVAFWRLNHEFEIADHKTKRTMSWLADTLTDPYFKKMYHRRGLDL